MIKEFYQAARAAGAVAGTVILHLWRIRAGVAVPADEKTAWDWVRHQPNWRDLVVWGPHFHAISFGHLMKSKDFEALTGWIYKNKGPLKSRDDVEGVAYYALSHIAFEKGRKSSTEYGFMHSRYVKVHRRWKEEERMMCPVCHKPLYLVGPNENPAEFWHGAFSIRTTLIYGWRKGPPLGPFPEITGVSDT